MLWRGGLFALAVSGFISGFQAVITQGIRHLFSGGLYGCLPHFFLASACYGSSHGNDSIEYGCPKVACGDVGVVLELVVVQCVRSSTEEQARRWRAGEGRRLYLLCWWGYQMKFSAHCFLMFLVAIDPASNLIVGVGAKERGPALSSWWAFLRCPSPCRRTVRHAEKTAPGDGD